MKESRVKKFTFNVTGLAFQRQVQVHSRSEIAVRSAGSPGFKKRSTTGDVLIPTIKCTVLATHKKRWEVLSLFLMLIVYKRSKYFIFCILT